MVAVPSKFYVTRVYRSAEEVLGWMVVADKEHTKAFENSKKKADQWATPYRSSTAPAMEPIYVSNEPRTGFRMVTNVSRYSTSNVVWRIMHPDGFEFEITSDNLCDLLETNTIIEGEFQDPLFFTHNKKLVNQKTKLFAGLIEQEEHKKAEAEKTKELEIGDTVRMVYEFSNNYRPTLTWNYVFCGKMHVISNNKNNVAELNDKSTLRFILKDLKDGRYYAVSKLFDGFTVTGHVDGIDRNEVVHEMNEQIKTIHETVSNEMYYDNYVPHYVSAFCVNLKPFKAEDLKMEYVEVPLDIVNCVNINKVYKIGDNQIFGYLCTHTTARNTQKEFFSVRNYSSDYEPESLAVYPIFGYTAETNIPVTNIDYDGCKSLIGYNSPFDTHNYGYSRGKDRLNLIDLPETIEVGYYTLRG